MVRIDAGVDDGHGHAGASGQLLRLSEMDDPRRRLSDVLTPHARAKVTGQGPARDRVQNRGGGFVQMGEGRGSGSFGGSFDLEVMAVGMFQNIVRRLLNGAGCTV